MGHQSRTTAGEPWSLFDSEVVFGAHLDCDEGERRHWGSILLSSPNSTSYSPKKIWAKRRLSRVWSFFSFSPLASSERFANWSACEEWRLLRCCDKRSPGSTAKSINSTSTVICSLGIAFHAGWKLTIVILVFIPLTIFSGTLQGRTLFNTKKRSVGRSWTEKGAMVIETIE